MPAKDTLTKTDTFTFPVTGANVRTVVVDGEPWFVAKDVAEVLGYSNTNKAVGDHCNHLKVLKGNDSLPLTSSPFGIGIIPESDVYRLIMRSKLPQAEAFEEWVTGTVLPAIRKDGMYVVGEEKVVSGELEETELVLKALTMLQGKVERLSKEKACLESTIDEHLKTLTVDEWRALNHLYLTWGEKIKLGKAATAISTALGIAVSKQMRTIDINGESIKVQPNLYPKVILDEAARSCGFTINLYLEE